MLNFFLYVIKRGGFTVAGVLFLCIQLSACASSENSSKSIFSISPQDTSVYRAILNHPTGSLHYIPSFDLTQLAYREIKPGSSSQTKALCVFIHGTASQSKLYLPLADTLKKNGIATALIDLRGHGHSGGEKGKIPSLNALVRDLRLVLFQLKKKYPDLPLILGGHSLGAGLCLKYFDFFRELKVDYVKPDGLILMSGGFLRAPDCDSLELARLDSLQKAGSFAQVSPLKLAAFIPGGLLGFQFNAINVNLPKENPLVQQALKNGLFTTCYTPQFFLAAFPIAPSKTYKHLAVPTLFLAGRQDELFPSCDAIYSYKKLNTDRKDLYLFNTSNHINIIWESADAAAQWINENF